MEEVKCATMQKKIDNLGRVVIPNDIRKALGICANDTLVFFTGGETVTMKLSTPKCPLCKNSLRNGKQLCDSCIDTIKAI